MEVLQTILMVIGAITLLWLVVKFEKGASDDNKRLLSKYLE